MNGLIKKMGMGCLLVASLAWGQDDAGQAGSFLRYGVGGRALGMGRAFTAAADDASGIYWNPAGILGAKRMELASMYANLYYDSQFAHMGLVAPRPLENVRNPVLRFLLGPSSAIGFGWVGLSMMDFEQRGTYGDYLNNFDLQENAFLLAWAHEQVHDWGILRWGATFKWVTQDFGGLTAAEGLSSAAMDRDQSLGLDLGLTFQPIHAPLFRIVALKYLLPLRLGFTVQNAVQPQWRGDDFPRIFRWGLAYRWILSDWIPQSWTEPRAWLEGCQVLMVYDQEFMAHRDMGSYFGMEAVVPIMGTQVAVTPRMGVNNRTESTSLGVGIQLPFSEKALLRVDYAYAMHPYLKADSRFFLTLQTGRVFDALHYRKKVESEAMDDKARKAQLYRILADYPNDEVGYAVEQLVAMDSTRAPRYYDLIGGLGRAQLLFEEAKSLLAESRPEAAKKKAEEAAREYQPAFMEEGAAALSETELLNYGEALLIAGQAGDALTVLNTVENSSLRREFLMGTAQKSQGTLPEAIKTFAEAARRFKEEQNHESMVSLAFLRWAECLAETQQYTPAITALERLLTRGDLALDPQYPRYPEMADGHIEDDASYLLGLCRILVGQAEQGVAGVLSTERYYPGMEYGRQAGTEMRRLVRLLESDDIQGLQSLSNELLTAYMARHQWPLP